MAELRFARALWSEKVKNREILGYGSDYVLEQSSEQETDADLGIVTEHRDQLVCVLP